MEETIDLREYFGIIRKRFWIIALITFVSVAVSAGVSFFVLNPVYEAQTTLIVNTDQNEDSQMTGDQFNVTQRLAVTYGEIIKSRAVLDRVINNLNLDMSYEQLRDSITVSTVKDTQIISVSVKDTNPNKAMSIANQISLVFSSEAQRLMNANSVEVVDRAIQPISPVAPNKTMNIAIAAVLGIMIGLFIVFLIEFLDNKIKTPQDIEKHLDLPLLGVIQNENRMG